MDLPSNFFLAGLEHHIVSFFGTLLRFGNHGPHLLHNQSQYLLKTFLFSLLIVCSIFEFKVHLYTMS